MIILDIEATGLDIKKCGIVSIGAVDFTNPSRQFYVECRTRREALVSEEALSVNGFSLNDIYDSSKPNELEAIENLAIWINKAKDRTISGLHVASYDIPMIREVSTYMGKEIYLGKKVVDLHSVCAAHVLKLNKKYPLKEHRSGINTDFIHPYCGLPEEPKPHNALMGAKFEAESLSRLIYGRCLLEEFEIYEVPKYLIVAD